MAQNVQQWFMAVDVDRSGQISVQELQKALALGNLHFSLAVCRHLIRLYDKDQSGQIGLNEFVDLHGYLVQCQQTFYQHDRNRAGYLSPPDVWNAVQSAGYRLDTPAFEASMRAFDPDRNARFELAEYIAFTLFLRSAANTFQGFDQARESRVHLDFNQFVYAAANCR
ncbi:hypothetical protein WJX73_008788 [Symbiochloris irregularis]|uniref:EF-hand domain-containing protein n=1 Tax=Symbiochloris irregularis TaxID=706552 RepID=A0AAW1PQC6_9CHLO